MWSLLCGMLEEGETPAECVRREIAEEIGVVLDPEKVEHVRTRDLHYGLEHAFFARIDFEIDQVVLTEGQRLGWFDETTSAATTLGVSVRLLSPGTRDCVVPGQERPLRAG
jgi:8-oxo-dGTP diphosphatase